jgi:hypothetical protein
VRVGGVDTLIDEHVEHGVAHGRRTVAVLDVPAAFQPYPDVHYRPVPYIEGGDRGIKLIKQSLIGARRAAER